jgi:hypothetical protein
MEEKKSSDNWRITSYVLSENELLLFIKYQRKSSVFSTYFTYIKQ